LSQLKLFSIGHSNHTLETFLDLLDQHKIEVLVDVRSQPFSKYTPHFNQFELKTGITRHGLKYLYLGKELGGRPPEGADFYDEEGHALYSRMAEWPVFLEGLVRLEKGMEKFRVAIMCSEEDPTHCHRHLLISRVLVKRGATIEHIRGDGSLQAEEELAGRKPGAEHLQLSLFPDEEYKAWKSSQPVLPKKARPNSSES
jgi:uncharacterized protein (DUF488 family)